MSADSAMAIDTGALPIELRLALDLVAWRAGKMTGRIPAHIIGDPRLGNAFRWYGVTDDGAPELVSLGASSDELRDELATVRVDRVLTVAAGPLGPVVSPLRRAPLALPRDTMALWRELGYRRVWQCGIHGIGSLVWATADRLARALERPALADRCRIAMLRSLATSSLGCSLAMVMVSEYRRAA